MDVINRFFQISNIEIINCSLDKTEDEFTVFLKFKNVNQPELTELIKDFQSDNMIKEIIWSS